MLIPGTSMHPHTGHGLFLLLEGAVLRTLPLPLHLCVLLSRTPFLVQWDPLSGAPNLLKWLSQGTMLVSGLTGAPWCPTATPWSATTTRGAW